jgi:hypothetical protein
MKPTTEEMLERIDADIWWTNDRKNKDIMADYPTAVKACERDIEVYQAIRALILKVGELQNEAVGLLSGGEDLTGCRDLVEGIRDFGKERS